MRNWLKKFSIIFLLVFTVINLFDTGKISPLMINFFSVLIFVFLILQHANQILEIFKYKKIEIILEKYLFIINTILILLLFFLKRLNLNESLIYIFLNSFLLFFNKKTKKNKDFKLLILLTILAIVFSFFKPINIIGSLSKKIMFSLIGINNLFCIRQILLKRSLKTKKQNKMSINLYLFFSLIILGMILRVVLLKIMPLDMDEGIHLYDARLINSGKKPFLYFLAREPYFLYLISFFTKIFGHKLETTRIIASFSMLLTTIPIYLLSQVIYKKRNISLLSVLIFWIYPFFIENTIYGNLYSIYPLFTSISFLFLFYFIKKPESILLSIIAGFFFGLTVHVYRLHVFYFPILGLVFYLNKINFKQFSIFFISLLIPFILPIIYFSKLTSYTNFEIMYGTNELLLALISLPLTYFLYKYLKKMISRKTLILLILLIVSIIFVSKGLDIKIKISIIAEALILSGPIAISIIISIVKLLKLKLNKKLIEKLFVIFLIIFTLTKREINILGARNIDIVTTILTYFILFILLIKSDSKNIKFDKNHTILMLAPLFFYIQHVQIFPNFLSSTIVLSSISASKIFIEIYNENKKLFYCFIISFFFIGISIYYNFRTKDRYLLTQEARKEIEEYINNETDKNDSILTMANLFVVETDRNLLFDISRLSPYIQNDVYMPDYIGLAKNMVSKEELIYGVENNTKLIILDNRIKNIINDEEFKKVLENNFEEDLNWKKYEITSYKKKTN